MSVCSRSATLSPGCVTLMSKWALYVWMCLDDASNLVMHAKCIFVYYMLRLARFAWAATSADTLLLFNKYINIISCVCWSREPEATTWKWKSFCVLSVCFSWLYLFRTLAFAGVHIRRKLLSPAPLPAIAVTPKNTIFISCLWWFFINILLRCYTRARAHMACR